MGNSRFTEALRKVAAFRSKQGLPARRAVAAFLIPALAACSTESLYDTAQAWQRNQCERLIDRADRERCLSNAAVPYEQYKRRTEPAQEPASR